MLPVALKQEVELSSLLANECMEGLKCCDVSVESAMMVMPEEIEMKMTLSNSRKKKKEISRDFSFFFLFYFPADKVYFIFYHSPPQTAFFSSFFLFFLLLTIMVIMFVFYVFFFTLCCDANIKAYFKVHELFMGSVSHTCVHTR